MSTSSGRYQVGATGRWSGTLKREDDARVGVSNITAATISLRDATTGEYLRGAEGAPQDIWPSGTNDFTYADGTDSEGNPVTNIGWNVQVEDVALVNETLGREEHVAEILVEHTQDGEPKTLRHTHRLRVVDAPGLCTYDDILASVPELNEDTSRLVIEDAIEAFSALVERRCQRRLRKSTTAIPTTQVFSLSHGQRVLQCERYPIDFVTSIKEDYSSNFTSAVAIEATDFFVDSTRGQIERRNNDWLYGLGTVEVVYAGGAFRDTGTVDADLRWAAVQQVTHWWKFRDKLGVISVSVPGSTVTQYSQKPLLPQVDEVVRLYRSPRHW